MSSPKFSKRFTFEELKEESTPRKIVYATLQEIAVNGIGGTTTKAISERADLSTGIIHHYFDTKDNLIYAAYIYLVMDRYETTLQIFEHESDPKTRLQAMIRMNFSSVHVSPEARDVWAQFWADAVTDERVGRLLKVYYRRYRSNLGAVFCDCGLSPENARKASQSLLANIHGVWFTHRFSDSPKERERAIELVEQHLEMLLGYYSSTA